jgi:hypothetical protein
MFPEHEANPFLGPTPLAIFGSLVGMAKTLLEMRVTLTTCGATSHSKGHFLFGAWMSYQNTI